MGKLIDGDELLSIVRHMTVVDKSVMHRILIQMPTVDAVTREIEQANKQAAYVRGYEDGQKDKYGRLGDAVEVVRCRDCKWYQPDADKWCGYFECMGFEPDDYCSQGERRECGDG